MAFRKKGPAEKLAELEERERQIKAQIQRERAKVSEQKRKEDSRRKIIAGANALTHAEKNPDSEFARTLHRLLNEYTKPHERHLFGLDPLPDQKDAPPSH